MTDTENAVTVAPEQPVALPAGATDATCAADLADFLHVPVLRCAIERSNESWKAVVEVGSILDVEKALQANGKLLYGAKMTVQALDSATAKRDQSRDARGQAYRNLYVLNLPLDVTTEQLKEMFSAHGTVTHCVILAMLDAQARRRGFVDMEDAESAARAVQALHGYTWHGYPMDVSYALVQRGNGPVQNDEELAESTAIEVTINPVILIDEEDVHELILKYAKPVRVAYPTGRHNGRPVNVRVEMATAEEAKRVYYALLSHSINGEPLPVRRVI
ncbi:hypothetical protein MCUN1_002904 [Malassezia cuniculi]|uniref:RRM domain-containing protein n=1 Tax=Malassezia cuniculi TaxID=948313 RepID=A0AAF0ES89_9BASI|nr:hypothetical protein MCUN1_002904 [Malassezia cuniculi]